MRGSIRASVIRNEPAVFIDRRPNAFVSFVQRARRSPPMVIGFILFTGVLLMAALAPLIASHDPIAISVGERLQPPSSTHLFGTDDFGRDLFSRVVWGSQLAVRLGTLSVLVSVSGGIVLGLMAGYYGGWVDQLISRAFDLIFAFPAVLSARQREYVEAARAIGARASRVMARHILPNVIAPVIILSATRFGAALLAGSGLSFIGLGVPIPQPEWGAIIATGRDYIGTAWWITAFPGVLIAIAVLGVNLLGDGLRDVLDPRMRD